MSKILTQDGSAYQYLVSWKDMLKGSEEPLPLRPFSTRQEAESYILGCSDVIVMQSKDNLDVDAVTKDFIITTSE